jgi:hypothetical protein
MEKNIKKINLYFVIQVFILLTCWLEVLVFWSKIPPQIPWFYSLSWGEDQLMNKPWLFLILGMACFITLATSYIANWTKKGDPIVEKAVLISLLLANILLFINLSRVLAIFVL